MIRGRARDHPERDWKSTNVDTGFGHLQVVEVNGINLSYTTAGQGLDVVFVHGIPTDYRAWTGQLPFFAANYRVLAYSRRPAEPNNNSVNLAQSTIESNASDLVELIRKQCVSPVNLVGHSYGGFIAAYVAVNNPELVRKLVLVEPGISTVLIQDPRSKTEMLSLVFHHPSVALAAGSYLRRYYNPMLDAYHSGNLEKALRLFLDGLMNRTNALDGLPDDVQSMVRDNARTIGEVEARPPRFGRAEARRINAPTLLINGSVGTKILQAINRELTKVIPSSQLVTIPRASHFPHLENSKEFNESVSAFFSQS